MSGLSSNQDVFDVRKIRRLVELMKQHDLTEIDLREGPTRIQIRRGSEPLVTGVPAARPAAPAPAAAAAARSPERPPRSAGGRR